MRREGPHARTSAQSVYALRFSSSAPDNEATPSAEVVDTAVTRPKLKLHTLALGWRFGLLAGENFLIVWFFKWGFTISTRPYFN